MERSLQGTLRTLWTGLPHRRDQCFAHMATVGKIFKKGSEIVNFLQLRGRSDVKRARDTYDGPETCQSSSRKKYSFLSFPHQHLLLENRKKRSETGATVNKNPTTKHVVHEQDGQVTGKATGQRAADGGGGPQGAARDVFASSWTA